MQVTARRVADVIWGAELLGDPVASGAAELSGGASPLGDPGGPATRVDPLWLSVSGSLTWIKNGTPWPRDVDSSIVIAGDRTVLLPQGEAVIRCDNPRLGLGYALREFFAKRFAEPDIERSHTARIHSSAVIGEPGMAYEWDPRLLCQFAIPHIAGVVIGPEVDVGPFAAIMRGLLQDTVVKKGAKIGNHVTVGHGALVGADAIVCPHAVIGGSANIGARAFLGIGARIRPGVRVGAGATIGQGSDVVCDVPRGETWFGSPARRKK